MPDGSRGSSRVSRSDCRRLASSSVARTIAALLRKELLAELVVQRRQPHWRQDENGKPIGLKLTKNGYAAIGADCDEPGDAEARTAAPAIDSVRAGAKQATG
jgi:hypothetical protein